MILSTGLKTIKIFPKSFLNDLCSSNKFPIIITIIIISFEKFNLFFIINSLYLIINSNF